MGVSTQSLLDAVTKQQSLVSKLVELLQAQADENASLQSQRNDLQAQAATLTAANAALTTENADLKSRLADADSSLTQLVDIQTVVAANNDALVKALSGSATTP